MSHRMLVNCKNFALTQGLRPLFSGLSFSVHEGELVWSCRLEEKIKYGRFMHTVPREQEHPEEEKTVERKTEPAPELPLT